MTTPASTRQEVTLLLGEWSNGDDGALEKLFPLVQPELHRLAHHYMSRERAGHNLQTTAILNEANCGLLIFAVHLISPYECEPPTVP
jgi:hypothetical protein